MTKKKQQKIQEEEQEEQEITERLERLDTNDDTDKIPITTRLKDVFKRKTSELPDEPPSPEELLRQRQLRISGLGAALSIVVLGAWIWLSLLFGSRIFF